MKKLTKRNRKRNRKIVFGYHTECTPAQRSNYTTTGWWLFKTCSYAVGGCCDP